MQAMRHAAYPNLPIFQRSDIARVDVIACISTVISEAGLGCVYCLFIVLVTICCCLQTDIVVQLYAFLFSLERAMGDSTPVHTTTRGKLITDLGCLNKPPRQAQGFSRDEPVVSGQFMSLSM
jgi:hypothetical protein